MDSTKSITFRLIRELCRKKAGEDLENDNGDITSVETLNLNSMGIGKIDNLEVFHNLRELYLRNNEISVIENLELQSNVSF